MVAGPLRCDRASLRLLCLHNLLLCHASSSGRHRGARALLTGDVNLRADLRHPSDAWHAGARNCSGLLLRLLLGLLLQGVHMLLLNEVRKYQRNRRVS